MISERLLMESALAVTDLELPDGATWEWVESKSGQRRIDVLRAAIAAFNDMKADGWS